MTRVESGSLLKLGDAPGALKMVAFSYRSRVPSGEARPPVTKAPTVGAASAGRAWGWGQALGKRGCKRGRGKQARGLWGNSLPLGPTCVQVHLSLPGSLLCSHSRINVLQMFAASLPAGGSAGNCASERKVSSWQEPISQMGEGKFSLRFPSSSQPKLLGIFPEA